jgi:hypothetical protein
MRKPFELAAWPFGRDGAELATRLVQYAHDWQTAGRPSPSDLSITAHLIATQETAEAIKTIGTFETAEADEMSGSVETIETAEGDGASGAFRTVESAGSTPAEISGIGGVNEAGESDEITKSAGSTAAEIGGMGGSNDGGETDGITTKLPGQRHAVIDKQYIRLSLSWRNSTGTAEETSACE